MAFRSRRGSFAQSLKGLDSAYIDSLDGGKTAEANNQWFFEVAWEVANQSN